MHRVLDGAAQQPLLDQIRSAGHRVLPGNRLDARIDRRGVRANRAHRRDAARHDAHMNVVAPPGEFGQLGADRQQMRECRRAVRQDDCRAANLRFADEVDTAERRKVGRTATVQANPKLIDERLQPIHHGRSGFDRRR